MERWGDSVGFVNWMQEVSQPTRQRGLFKCFAWLKETKMLETEGLEKKREIDI